MYQSKIVDLLLVQVAAAQQYSVTLRGYPALHDWVKKHTWALHSPPGDHDVLVTGGSNATIEVGTFLSPTSFTLSLQHTYPLCPPLSYATSPPDAPVTCICKLLAWGSVAAHILAAPWCACSTG